MRTRVFSFLLLILAVQVNAKTKKNPPAKIAVVGGGIGGSSAAYYLREAFGTNVQIDLFEKNDVLCGRVASVTVDGSEYEAGAAFNSKYSGHMGSFREKFGFEILPKFPAQQWAVFDGANYVLRSSSYWILAIIKMLWTFGLSFFRLNWYVEDFMKNVESIYDLQARGDCYDDLGSLLHAMGGDEFVESTQISAYKSFQKVGVSKYTVENWVSPAIGALYGQNASANGFLGAIATAGTQSGLWAIKGGNRQTCFKLVESSSTNVIHEEVERIRFDENATNEKFSIMTKQSSSTPQRYDIVVIATPIGRDMSHIDLTEACPNMDKCPSVKSGLRYRRYVRNVVKGNLNLTLFHCNTWRDCPSFILSAPEANFFWSITLTSPVDYDPTKDNFEPVYSVFAPMPLTDEQRDYLFESHTRLVTFDWMAFPEYTPPDELNSFVLNEAGLYYTSAIEWAASIMEMSAISGKNAALLAHRNWYSLPKGKYRKTEKNEL